MRKFQAIILFVAIISICGCSASIKEFDQTVTGEFIEDDKPVHGVRIQLQLMNEPDQKPVIAATNENGVFELHRKAFLGKWAVIVQDDLLSVEEDRKWLPVWHGLYGSAPDRVSFVCKKTQKSPWICTMNGMETQRMPNQALRP